MAAEGHKERFPSHWLNGGCRLGKATFAEMGGKEEDAPSPDLPDLVAEGGGSTRKSHSWRHQRVIGLTRKQSGARNCRLRPAHASSSSNAFASFRSAVSKPSVNQP